MTELEEELVQRARQGDLEAFNRLVLAYQGQVYALAYRLLGDAESAADAAQETFLSAFQHIGRFRKGSFRAWLLRITANFCYDVLRKRRTRPQSSLESLSNHSPETRFPAGETEEDPTVRAEQEELAQEIQRALNTLPPEQRAVVVLCDIEEFPYDQAARTLGISLGTLKSRLSRGRARLREYFCERRELLPASVRSIFASQDFGEPEKESE